MKIKKQKPAQNMKERIREINGVKPKASKSRSVFRRYGVMASSLMFSASLFAYYCPPFMNASFAPWIAQHFATVGMNASQAILDHTNTISKDLTDQRNDILDAITVMTKQKNVVGNTITDTMNRTTQTQAATYQTMKVNEKQQQLQLEYGATGQGFKNCEVLAKRNNTASNQTAARNSIVERISTSVKAAPGTYGDPIKAQKEMLDQHNAKFCTPDQQASGMCGQSEMPGLSLQAATLFTETVEGSGIHEAQDALINNMVGLPDREISANTAKTPVGEEYLVTKLAKDARISPAINSLKAIQSEFVSIKTDDAHSSDGMPLIKQFRNEVNRYLGFDDEYKEWNKTLTVSEERGILKEILQVKALKLAIGERLYRSNERQEALLASLVSMEQELATGKYNLNDLALASGSEHKQRIALSQSIQATTE